MRQRPSIVYAWGTGGAIAALSALVLFATIELFKQVQPINVLHESIGFAVFALPMFILILTPAVIAIVVFRHTAVGSSGVSCLIVAEAVTFVAVLIWSGVDKFFPSDEFTAACFFVFALAGSTILWFRSREKSRRQDR